MALEQLITEKRDSCNPTFHNLPGFLDEKFSDVTVRVSYQGLEIKTYKLHRLILAGCSVVLHKSLEQHQTLDIAFMSPEEFELLIMFLYTGEMSFKSVSELCVGLFAANLYKLENLRSECSKGLQEKLTEDSVNAVLILQCDERFNFRADNAPLFKLADESINKDYRRILGSGVIEEIEMNCMKHLLQIEPGSGISEIEVFRALLRWTNARCRKLGIEKVPENQQEVAGDLIYNIRYNLIPAEILGKEVAKSGILSKSFVGIALRRFYDENVDVPFCTRSREQVEWHFESTCPREQHSLNQVGRCTAVASLSWDKNMKKSAWFPLPKSPSTNTQWEVQFAKFDYNDFGVYLRCVSLDAQFCAASIRLFAVAEGAPQIWLEVADILMPGWNCSTRFSKKATECLNVSPVNVFVRAQWTELDQLPPTLDLEKDNGARIQCSWQLRGWKAIAPTAERWHLYSEPFGRSGALWRMGIENRRKDQKRELLVFVLLQHLPSTVDWSGMCWNCSLSDAWNSKCNEQKEDMKENSNCGWILLRDVQLESRDPLNVNVVIHINVKK